MSNSRSGAKTMGIAGIPSDLASHYRYLREMPDGRVCGILRLLLHWTIHVDVHEFGYEDRYCYSTFSGARAALDAWDGTGDPVGWHRHPASGRRRNPGTGEEWTAW